MAVARDATSGEVRQLVAPESVHGLRVAPATSSGTPVPTLVQPHEDGVAVLTVLTAGQRTVDYPNALAPGQRLEPAGAGALVVVDGADVVGAVEAPWAVDATGRRLPTRYELRGDGGLRQLVDTEGATFPVVADPKYSVGWYRGPVYYQELYWSDMWKAKNLMDRYGKPVTALVSAICAKIPSAPAKAACAYTVNHRYGAYRTQVNSGIAHKRCVKIRNGFGPTDLWAWGIWTKKCIK
ncbi:hypothetical protein [Angustibacter luteus]